MAPKPYSEKSSHPADSTNDDTTGIPIQVLNETPSPESMSGATTPSPPPPHEQVPVETFVDNAIYQESSRIPDLVTPCYPSPGDIMPYDHSLPDFIRQITNQPNLANLQSLKMRVISTLISLHRMATYLPNLRLLDLEGSILNSLRDIGCGLKNLQVLKVGRCQLESLDGTFGLSSLRELYAEKNFINDVSPCSNLPHIRHIDVSGNRIRNISYAGFLSVCSKLKSIVFTGNPATEAEDYRKHVRRILPQLETLDGVPFTNEDNQEVKESELIENYCEGSDGSSTEGPDFAPVSPSDSMSNLLEFEEELFLLNKKYKQAKNLASQDQSDGVDCEMAECKTNFQLQDDFQSLNLHQNQAKANADSRNLNLKQKCASIQKLDKDMENRSKKSNLHLNTRDSEFPGSDGDREPSTSSSVTRKFRSLEKRTGRPSTAAESSEDHQRGVLKKRPSSATVASRREECSGLTRLTVGMPVCGNLTAALRNRKKIRNAWTDISGITRNHPEEAKVEVHVNGFGDNIDIDGAVDNEDDLIGEDVLITSQKWRESFRRFRSNNRARWEEEEEEQEQQQQQQQQQQQEQQQQQQQQEQEQEPKFSLDKK